MAMHRNKSVNLRSFAMNPRPDIPRSRFDRQSTHKTTFDAGKLIPVFIDEVLPGDTFNLKMTAFARLATPLFPIMDNMTLTSFFFFVPNRLVWDNWQKFMGERIDPDDSIDFLIPQSVSAIEGYEVNSLQDYFGLPSKYQINEERTFSHTSLPLRAYNLIWNEWFRDENLQDSVSVPRGDGPDDYTLFNVLRRGKRHDYFTSGLPWPQKGESVTLPLGDRAPISGLGVIPATTFSLSNNTFKDATTDALGVTYPSAATTSSSQLYVRGTAGNASAVPDVFADLSEATSATINQLRQSFQIQKLLERDARGGTRYIEIIRSHFGVISPDARLQRPEYLGGGSTPVTVNPISQTSATNVTGSDSPLGTLGAMGTVLAQGHGFSTSFVEHGFVIGLVCVDADLTYQQGVRRMWNRRTRYDFYFPVFAMLGEQAILNREIYITGNPIDEEVFAYQERWAEYRYMPSQVSGYFRSTVPGTLDAWHLAQRFNSTPTLNSTFIESRPPVDRIVAVGAEANGVQFLFDSFFSVRTVRAMPMYSIPGLIDHF